MTTPTRAEVEALADEMRDQRMLYHERHAKAEKMLRAYAATLPPQAAPVAEGKPTKEPSMTEPTKEQVAKAIEIAEDWLGEKDEATWGWYPVEGTNLAMDIANALAAAAQKAALEAEARESETLSYIEDAVETLEAMDLHIDNPLYDRLRAFLEEKASVDRFMRLLEAAQPFFEWAKKQLHFDLPQAIADDDSTPVLGQGFGDKAEVTVGDLRRLCAALSAFPQPEKQP